MSQAELIRQGEIQKRKQIRMQATIDAKAALRALVNGATHALTKPVDDINTAELTSHLEQLVSKQEDVKRLDEEIKELEY